MNGDGQMDINEFSIACKLITMKLKGFEIPKALPPAMTMNMQPAVVSQAQMMPPNSLNIMGMQQAGMNMMHRMQGIDYFLVFYVLFAWLWIFHCFSFWCCDCGHDLSYTSRGCGSSLYSFTKK